MQIEITQLHQDFVKINTNAMYCSWIISPLDYFWPDGKKIFDSIFSDNKSVVDDEIVVPMFYKMTMSCNFRAKFIVLGYMKEPVISEFSLEIENGLLHFYGLDFVSTISQWIYVFEGVLRDVFELSKQSEIVEHGKWRLLKAKNLEHQELLDAFVDSIKNFTKNVLFTKSEDYQSTIINRHLLSHGKIYNKRFYSQKNALKLLFALDTLLMIEMIQNGTFPPLLDTTDEEEQSIKNRTELYCHELTMVFDDYNLLKAEIMKEHIK